MTCRVFLAHGLGSRADLPVPLWLAIYAGLAAVLVSFFALGALWTTPKLRGKLAGRALSASATGIADSRPTRSVLRVVGLVLFAVLLAVAWFGTDESSGNPAVTWFYVWFWVGMVPVSLLLGPVWPLVNPLRTLAGLLWLLPPFRDGGAWSRRLPERLGYRPAIAGLVVFLWLELVFVHSDAPLTVALFVTAYAVVHVMAGAVFGPRWFDQGDAFEVYFGLVAALSPWGRRDDGRLVLRNPLDNLLTVERATGLTPVVLVVLGSTAFDGMTRLPIWTDLTDDADGMVSALLGTVGLAGAIAMMSLAYVGGIRLTRPYLRTKPAADGTVVGEPSGAFAHSLIPIMVGYTVAHYFSFAVFEGQAGIFLASDPLGIGWNLFGTVGGSVDYLLVSTGVIAFVQVAGIVLGHVLGVTSAHDRAIGMLRPKYVKVGQYPMLALMVGYTAVGIALVAGA